MTDTLILAIDDEEDILELINFNLTKERYQVVGAVTGEAGLEIAKERKPDLILLDLMLPGINGLDVCRALKEDAATAHIPVIILSARGEEIDIVTGLELGADDYMTKPFSPRILIARVRTVLRRNKTEGAKAENTVLDVDQLHVDPQRHEVRIEGDQKELTATEFRVLYLLASNRGRVFTRSQIVKGVHGDDYPVTDRSVDVQIVGLRRKLENYGSYIETIRGVGYRFKE